MIPTSRMSTSDALLEWVMQRRFCDAAPGDVIQAAAERLAEGDESQTILDLAVSEPDGSTVDRLLADGLAAAGVGDIADATRDRFVLSLLARWERGERSAFELGAALADLSRDDPDDPRFRPFFALLADWDQPERREELSGGIERAARDLNAPMASS